MARDESLLRAVELWFPLGEVLAFGAGAYRSNQELAEARARVSFNYGDGLAGAVWAGGKALLSTELTSSFEGAELAALAGIDAAVGCPMFDGERLVAVLTLLLSNRREAPGCLEVWEVVDELQVLKYGAGYYVHCAELGRFAPLIQFPRGSGLP